MELARRTSGERGRQGRVGILSKDPGGDRLPALEERHSGCWNGVNKGEGNRRGIPLSKPFWPQKGLWLYVNEDGEPLVGFEHKCCDLT